MASGLRNSSLKQRKLHGFRAKPWSHMKKTKKRKPGGMGNRRSSVLK